MFDGEGEVVSLLYQNRSYRLFFALMASLSALAFAQSHAYANDTDLQLKEFKPAVFTALPGRSQCRGADGYISVHGGQRTFLWRPEWLAMEKVRVAADPGYAKLLRNAADAALKRGPYSVTDKLKMPASRNLHDYYSIGPYWWPTTDKPNGEPYIRRDGYVNPESRGQEFDKDRMLKFSSDVRLLALAYHHFGDDRYAVHAATLLRVWFLNRDTRMNPNLNFGQAVPGVNTGRGEGIIELNALSAVVESVGVIGPAGALSKTDQAGLEKWFGDMTSWMKDSPIGQEERAKSNNHGIHYDYLLTQFALFARREPLAQQIVAAFPARRIAPQILGDGSLPEELARTRSWHYSYFALEGAVKVATLGECVGLDIWSAKTKDGRGLAKAFAYLAPYQSDIDRWPYKDVGLSDPEKTDDSRRKAMIPLRMMAWGTGDKQYEALASVKYVAEDINSNYALPAFVTSQKN